MNDPHVVALGYRVTHDRDVDYDEAGPLTLQTDRFKLHVESGTARFSFVEHYSSVEDARAAISEFISAWEAHVKLQFGRGRFELRFDHALAEIIDRAPEPNVVEVSTAAIAMAAVDGTCHVSCYSYPEPPGMFKATPEVAVMIERLARYREYREPLASVAYFCLDVVEHRGIWTKNARRNAAEHFEIDYSILHQIGLLSSTAGGPDARKAAGRERALTPREHEWLAAATKALVGRVGERAAAPDAELGTIKMDHLPPL